MQRAAGWCEAVVEDMLNSPRSSSLKKALKAFG